MGSVLRKCESIQLAFAFVLLLLIFIQFSSNAQLLPQDEVKTLQTISDKLENRYWKTIDRNSCNDGNQTFGGYVTCDCSFNQSTVCHVTNITMKSLNLPGVFPAEFGNLSHLLVIDFTRNYISGSIPTSLSRNPGLLTLGLLGNRITGRIPDEIGQIASLRELILEDNQLEGALPPSLGNLKNLSRLLLSGNFFNGTIPATYGNMQSLTQVRFNGNMISGKIPDFIGNWTNLSIFDIQGTSMEGPIPSSLSILRNLTILRISDHDTKGVPLPNLTDLTKLQYLVLRNCSITDDKLLNYIGNSASELKLLDLSYNQLSGIIPDSLQPIQYLFLTNNSLSGPLPNWIQNSKDNIDVSYNNFTGSSSTVNCQQSNVNLVSSYSSSNDNTVGWCLKKDLPCSRKPQYHSLFINCGGSRVNFEGNDYEADTTPGGPSNFYFVDEKWAYSSTGAFLYRDNALFVAQEISNPNVSSIYQTARLAPLSLKYYGICLRNGSYNVTLHFAEIMFSNNRTFDSLGRRFFDVEIQGNLVLKDFNIAASAGGVEKPLVINFPEIHVNGTLEIYLYWSGRGTTSLPDRGVYGPLISAITVKPNFKIGTGLSSGVIAGIVLASCAILASLLILLRMMGCLGGKEDENEELRGLGTGYFPLRQIKTATDDFSAANHIGEGGFGPVYKGVLPDGRVIAVKKLSAKSKQGNREFVNEIGLISAIQHPNLVNLYGCCIEGKELLLVYEYMENNSLARALFGREDQKLNLDWPTRKKICLGIARGLVYLHEESRLKIVHRDIKATNVLLDKDLTARISDFGLAKLDDEDENTHISTRIAGTVGYMAPEYAMRGYLTDKADVYSFGVVILEIVSGKSNTNYRPKEEFVYLLDWAYVLQERGNLLELVDPILGSNYSQKEALRFLNLALLCTNPSPTLRPKMSSVVSMIDGKLPVQALVVERPNGDSRFRAFENLSQDSQVDISRSSNYSSEHQRSISMDGPWINSSISMQSYKDETQAILSSSKFKPN